MEDNRNCDCDKNCGCNNGFLGNLFCGDNQIIIIIVILLLCTNSGFGKCC